MTPMFALCAVVERASSPSIPPRRRSIALGSVGAPASLAVLEAVMGLMRIAVKPSSAMSGITFVTSKRVTLRSTGTR